VLLHHLAAAGIVRLQELPDTRFGPRNVIVDADSQVHRAVERIQVAARLAPHRENLPPLPAEELRRRPDREPAVEVARGTLHRALGVAAHPHGRAAFAVRARADPRVLKPPPPVPGHRLSGPERTA